MSERRVRGYAICATGRSGSNYLSQALESTGRLGRPLEYFNGPARRELNWPDYPDDPELQIQAILSLGATPNGVYGLKLFPSQFLQVQGSRWTQRLPGLHFVHLERLDLLGQAISWARALQTGAYRSTSAPRARAAYDRALIERCLGGLAREQARWRLWFARTGISPLLLTYEAVVADPAAAVARIAGHLGVEGAVIDPRKIDLAIQRDSLSGEWRSRFLAEAGEATSIAFEFGDNGLPEPVGS